MAFLAGLFLALTGGALLYQRLRREYRRRLEENGGIKEREVRLEFEEWTHKRERELETQRAERELEIQETERKVRAREDEAVATLLSAEKEREQLEKRRGEYDRKLAEVEREEDRLRQLARDYRQRLEESMQWTRERAREELLEITRRECEDEVRELREELLNKSEREIEEEARRKLITCMQRLSSGAQEDITATLVPIPSDDMKGRIIGREGRNIKSFETLTGTSLLIDETPDNVLVSSFDPVRRETARIALESLIKDGRIHPSSIEEAVRRAEEEVKQSVVESGEDALRRLRLNRMHPEVVTSLGQLRFRLSNNQNSLEHSIEVANLCSLMAAELGLEPETAKRGGLLHDIGKVLDEDHAGSHAQAGAFFLKRIGQENAMVLNAVAGHHGEVPPESPYVALVMIADSLSAMRPGVRADSLDGYLQRVRSLEAIASGMEGVAEAYAIQAGREIRVIVEPDKISDKESARLARDLRRRIEDELQYPGTIRVTVIRETRAQETAK
ncbi:MAG: ribonuclease Y [Verrucomicrobia bacterium]|nr:ribonuclease Y [Verrucomicrobiota bacterium]